MARLIDADALKKQIEDFHCKDCNNYNFVKCRACHIDDAISYLDDAPTVGGWISVKDGLPEKNQIVIASDGEHTWDVGMYKSFCGKPSEWNWKKNTVKTVLWWMPKDGALPEPPKEEPQCPQPTP